MKYHFEVPSFLETSSLQQALRNAGYSREELGARRLNDELIKRARKNLASYQIIGNSPEVGEMRRSNLESKQL